MKKTAFLVLAALICVAGPFLLRCNLGGGGNSGVESGGGAGADFDASNYYTKDQVYTKTQVLNLMPTSAGETPKGLYYNTINYASGTPFNTASGKQFVLLFIYNVSTTPLDNTEADAIKICFGDSDANAMKYPLSINFSGTQVMIFPVPSGVAKVWTEGNGNYSDLFGSGSPDKVKVIPIWFTGGQF